MHHHTQLRDQIIRGRLAPGVRPVESDLALRFAVSRTPVREALARLVRESYVVAADAGRRTRFHVAPLTTAEDRPTQAIGITVQTVIDLRPALATVTVTRLVTPG